MSLSPDDQTPDVGNRIRLLRESRGYSLRDLAARSGLSLNAISRIERGDNSPTVTSLHLLAAALDVTITDFFDADDQQATVLTHPAHRLRSQVSGVLIESLGAGLRGQQLEPFLFHVAPGAGTQDQPVAHLGEEFVYCLAGSVDYSVNHQPYTLGAGDSLLFDASQPHHFHNPGPDPASLLVVFLTTRGSLRGQQAHLAR